VEESGNNAVIPQRSDKKMRAPNQQRRLSEITPPRIAPFVEHGNEFRDRILFLGLKVRSLRAFGVARCRLGEGGPNARMVGFIFLPDRF